MNTAPQRGILFVNHSPTRNGAPMMLLHFLRWLQTNGTRRFSTLFVDGGELLGEFASTGKTWIASESHWGPNGVRAQAAKGIGIPWLSQAAERADLRRFAASCSPGLIYLNGFHRASFRLVALLDLGVPILTHVHELGLLFRAQAGCVKDEMLSHTTRFIACSNAVKKNLIRQHAVNPASIEVVHESIAVSEVKPRRDREDILQELRFPADAVVIGGCGTVAWNKGTDIFVRLAETVCKQRDRARFVWVGSGFGCEVQQYEHDVQMIGLGGKVRFTGHVAAPADYLSAADIFLLPSREDSFPLTCLEAAALGKPIVCFADAGGMPEFVEEDAGFVVPYLDVEGMAGRLIALVDSEECRHTLGQAAHRKVVERHDVSKTGPRIAEIIETTIAAA